MTAGTMLCTIPRHPTIIHDHFIVYRLLIAATSGSGDGRGDGNSSDELLPWAEESPAELPPGYDPAVIAAALNVMDANQLQTALTAAIDAEDYELAGR